MAEHILTPPDELQIWLRSELARIDQLRADADRKRQEFELAPKLYRLEYWKTLIAAMAAVALLTGVLGYKIGAVPPAPIIIQLPATR
jgi:hypothetical protein